MKLSDLKFRAKRKLIDIPGHFHVQEDLNFIAQRVGRMVEREIATSRFVQTADENYPRPKYLP